MQAIKTKYIPATAVHGSRIKAECERGSIFIPYPHELSGEAVESSMLGLADMTATRRFRASVPCLNFASAPRQRI